MSVVDIVILSGSYSNCPRFGPPPQHTHIQEIFPFSINIEMSSGCTLSCVHWGSGIKWPGHEADYLFPSNAEVKMERSILPLLHIP